VRNSQTLLTLQTFGGSLFYQCTKDNAIICRLPLFPPQIVHLTLATSRVDILGIQQMKTCMKHVSLRIPVIMEALVEAVVV
jgi:hypothetical protein